MSKLKKLFIFTIVFIVCGIVTVPWPGNWNEEVPGKGHEPVQYNLVAFGLAQDVVYGDYSFSDLKNARSHVPVVLPLLFAPISNHFGLGISINLAAWIGLYLTFLCAYLFFWEVSGDFWPGVLAGFLFACSSYSLAEIGNGAISMGTPFMIPLTAFFIIRLLDKGGAVYGLLSVALIVTAFWYHMTFGLILILFTLAASVYAIFDEGISAAARGFLVSMAATTLILPIIVAMDIAVWLEGPHAPYYSLTSVEMLPILSIIGAVAATIFIKSKRLFWWGSAILFFVLACNNYLLDFFSYPIWLPKNLDSFRLIILVHLSLLALFALGIRELLDRLEAKGKDESLLTRGMFLLLIVVILVTSDTSTISLKDVIPPDFQEMLLPK